MGWLDEDLGPAWLRDYGEITANITEMAEFAARLKAEVVEHYIPHLAQIDADMTVTLPDPCVEFRELVAFLQTHQVAQQATTDVVHYYRDATGGLALAAEEISKRYRNTDAFSAARVSVVEQALQKTGLAPAQPPHAVGPGADQ